MVVVAMRDQAVVEAEQQVGGIVGYRVTGGAMEEMPVMAEAAVVVEVAEVSMSKHPQQQ